MKTAITTTRTTPIISNTANEKDIITLKSYFHGDLVTLSDDNYYDKLLLEIIRDCNLRPVQWDYRTNLNINDIQFYLIDKHKYILANACKSFYGVNDITSIENERLFYSYAYYIAYIIDTLDQARKIENEL